MWYLLFFYFILELFPTVLYLLLFYLVCSGYSSILHQYSWPSRCSWNIKHYYPTPFPYHMISPPGLVGCGVRVARSFVFCAMFCRSLFVLFVLFSFVIVLSVLLGLTASDYPFDIFKLFSFWVFSKWDEWFIIKFDKMVIKSPHFGDWQHVKWWVQIYFHILSEQNILHFMVISTILLLFSLICVDLRKQSICKQ